MPSKKRIFLAQISLSAVMIWIIIFITVSCNLVIAGDTNMQVSIRESSDPIRVKPDTLMCGPNGLYLMLRLHGIPVESEAIKKYIPTHPDGMSLLEVRDALDDLGLSTEIRKCSVTELCENFKFPVLALTTFFLGRSGHYMIVLGANKDSMYLMDTTAGRISKNLPKKVENIWLGYILVPNKVGNKSGITLMVSVLLWSIAAYIIFHFTSGTQQKSCRNRLKQPSTNLGLFLLTFLVILVCCGAFAVAKSTDISAFADIDKERNNLFWRLPENDGINSLYMQLRLLGYGGNYDMFRKQASDGKNLQNLRALSILAKKTGINLIPRKLTYSELENMDTPVLVHIEEEGIVKGSFNLHLGGDSRSVSLVGGAFARWMQMPRDRFKRAWTGYALIFRPTINWHTMVLRYGTLALISYSVLLVLSSLKLTVELFRRQASLT